MREHQAGAVKVSGDGQTLHGVGASNPPKHPLLGSSEDPQATDKVENLLESQADTQSTLSQAPLRYNPNLNPYPVLELDLNMRQPMQK